MANTTVNIDIQVQSKSLNELENELAQINKELKEVPIGSKAFQDLSTQAQGVTRELQKAEEAAKGFTSEEKFRAADGAIKLLGGSLASVVGTLGVLGVETEAFGEFEKKAASAIAVAIGFKDIGEGISQLGPLLGKAGTAIKGFSITTRQALIATGVGAFVVALGTVIAYWDDITSAVTKFGEKVPFVGKAIQGIKDAFDAIMDAARPVLEFLGIMPDEFERANAAVIESNNTLITSLEREIAVLEASGASAEEVYKKKKELLDAQLDNLKRNNADAEEIYKKETEIQVLEAKEATRIRTEEEKKKTEATKKEADERAKAEEKAQERIKKAIEAADKEYQRSLNSRAQFEKQVLAVGEAEARNIEDAKERAKALLKVEQDRLVEERRLREEALTQMVDDGVIYDSDLQEQLELLDEEFAAREIALERETQQAIDDINQDGLDKRKAEIKEEFDERREKLQQYKDLFSNILENISELSQQRFDRELRYLERERSEVETNTNLTEEQRIQALNNIEAKEREVEERRIKAERDQFTLRQAILLAEEVMKTKFFVQEQVRIAALTSAEASAAASSVAIEGVKQGGKAAMSLGTFVATLGPLGVAVFAASIGGIIASIVAARKNAKAQIAALGVPNISGGGINTSSIPSSPPSTQNVQERAPQQLMATPMVKTYVLTGDVTSGQEAQAKLNTKRTIS